MTARTIWRWLARLPCHAGILPPACRDVPDVRCRDRGTCNWIGECLITGHRRAEGRFD